MWTTYGQQADPKAGGLQPKKQKIKGGVFMQKTKRPLSFLLAVVMVISMFAAAPFTASATTYSSDYIEARNLQVGDIITGTAEGADFYGYTIILKGGT